MNDLYIEPFGETNDYEPIPCDACDEPLDPDTVLLVGDMSERTPHCRACADMIAASDQPVRRPVRVRGRTVRHRATPDVGEGIGAALAPL